jgi:hypothetical protein
MRYLMLLPLLLAAACSCPDYACTCACQDGFYVSKPFEVCAPNNPEYIMQAGCDAVGAVGPCTTICEPGHPAPPKDGAQ